MKFMFLPCEVKDGACPNCGAVLSDLNDGSFLLCAKCLKTELHNLKEDNAGLKAANAALAKERDEWKRRAQLAETETGEELE